MKKKTCVAMLLAGGQGSRLGVLTKTVAKPAVPYGGKYRIIDFPLSNCANSGIDTVGVLTQYQPLELNAYIGSGAPWDLDLTNGGVFVLPPYQKAKGSDWYRGTANAIYQNMAFIEQYQPDYVLVLSGDHIYKMDYNAMLNYHIRKGADATIAVRPVPWEEASRFGIMNTDADNNIIEFEEKPKNPKSNKASMGIYMFTWAKLRDYLIADEADKKSSNDFGKNIIPAMLADKQVMVSYDFEGYWKDVGTIESLWEANMDLLSQPMPIDLHEKQWRIFARNPGLAPHYIAKGAVVSDSLITEGCEVHGNVKHSVLFAGVTIEEGAEIVDAVVMPHAVVRRGAVVRRSIIAEGAIVGPGSIVGEETGNIAVVGHSVTLPAGVKVAAGQQVDEETTF
ncbi:MAG: glucose-1-phosphate adenylyltransferase [Christensenellaceae bacterium]|nr:glucose-1-phosphate adenylyltransferase [Christensenellaceae bacterium]